MTLEPSAAQVKAIKPEIQPERRARGGVHQIREDPTTAIKINLSTVLTGPAITLARGCGLACQSNQRDLSQLV
ncbi:hypothetical protein RRG08_048632 [Elysia crispata]|uniref:Uncharacterized protein n=1 Tax=Elysia crispata TaxID=231223 RepID=A0AAE1ACV1_9GAST|nr:hypothetical protein RRG08_048632 [Elysia crispata]